MLSMIVRGGDEVYGCTEYNLPNNVQVRITDYALIRTNISPTMHNINGCGEDHCSLISHSLMLKRVASSVPVHLQPYCGGRFNTVSYQRVLVQQRSSLSPQSSTMACTETASYLADFVRTQDTSNSIQIVPHNEIPSDALIVKSLVWTYHKTNPVLIVLNLASSVDKAKLAKYLQLNHVKHLRMATPEQVLSTTGQEVGNVSPIGHKEAVRTIVDESLLTLAGSTPHANIILYGGGGSTGFELKLSLQDLLHYSKGEVVDIRSVKVPNADASPALACDDNVPETVPSEMVLKMELPAVLNSIQVVALAKQVRDLAIQKESHPQLQRLLGCLYSPYSATQPELLTAILNTGTSTSGKTALHLASWKGSIESVRLLLQYGADVNAYSIGSGNYGKTAIFYAITQCRDDVVRELLAHNASVKIVNNKGQTPRSLGPSHLVEETICLIEQHESRDTKEWLNFYTTHYCDKNTCFGDLDPRFQANTVNNESSNLTHTNADGFLSLPRSINATTFEFRRNHFKSYTKKAHHIDDLVVALLRADKPIADILSGYVEDVDCTTIAIHHPDRRKQQPDMHLTHVEADTFVGYVASVSTCGDAVARVLPIAQYLHTRSTCTINHPHALKWTVTTKNDATTKDIKDNAQHKVHYEYLQLHSTPASVPPTLHEGDIVVIKGDLDVTHSALSCTPTSTLIFHTSTDGRSCVHNANKSAISSHKALKKAAKAKRAEKSTAKAIEEDTEINVITCEASLSDIKDSFVPVQSAQSEHTNTSANTDIPVTVVDNMDTLLQFNRDVQSLLNVAMVQHNTSVGSATSATSTYIDAYIAANPSRLYTIIGLDCEWRPGETYLRYLERQKAKADGENINHTIVPTTDTPATAVVDTPAATTDVEKEVYTEEDDEYRVAILQIATRTGVYLLDMQELTTCMFNNNCITLADSTITELPPTLSQLNHTLGGLFSSPLVLKLGFKVAPDFEKLAASYPFLSCFTRIQSVVDTCTIAQVCVPGYVKQGFVPEYWMNHKRLKQLSLTKLLAMVLDGKGLSKEQQCSRWHLRPLTPAQISYAALDAASLLTIFDFFTARDFPAEENAFVPITTDTVLEHKHYRICSANLKYHILDKCAADGSEVQFFTGLGMVIRSLLGLQIVGQSWTLLQEEPVDYAVYVIQQEALQITENNDKRASTNTIKFKKLSEAFVISPVVTDFIRKYTQLALSSPDCGNNSVESVYKDFLGEYVSSSKDTCVEFVQALRKYETQAATTGAVGVNSTHSSAGLNDSPDAGPVVSKMQNGMALVEDTMIIFVNFPVAVQENKAANITTDESSSAVTNTSTTDNLFLRNGEYVKWAMEAPLLVRENSNRVGTLRSLLLHQFLRGSGVPSEEQCMFSIQNRILLFVRQNAAPYMFCGKVDVASIGTSLSALPTQDHVGVNNNNAAAATTATVAVSTAAAVAAAADVDVDPVKAAGSTSTVLDITLQVKHFDLLFGTVSKPSDDQKEEEVSLYKNMVLRSLGVV